jgi:riboflavin kinase/FMN adenylyltransferase
MPFEILHSAEEWRARFASTNQPTVVTIGNFDGLHCGHQAILRKVREIAQATRRASSVLTFYPHPARVLRPQSAPTLLMTLPQRLAAIEAMGLDAALVLRFDEELARVSAEDFARRFLVETMHAEAILVGDNFRFGHRQAGDVKMLAVLGKRWGFDVEIVRPVLVNGVAVSSTAIRTAIFEGRVEDAKQMLGRPYALEGKIQTGTGQGRKLVVPTLNLATEQEALPKRGVYATEALVEGKTYLAATNVGVRPTFDGSNVTIESHLFDFNESLTNGKLEVRFWTRLRDERKFSGPEELRAQILKDIERAKEFFRTSKIEPQT